MCQILVCQVVWGPDVGSVALTTKWPHPRGGLASPTWASLCICETRRPHCHAARARPLPANPSILQLLLNSKFCVLHIMPMAFPLFLPKTIYPQERGDKFPASCQMDAHPLPPIFAVGRARRLRRNDVHKVLPRECRILLTTRRAVLCLSRI